MVRRRRASASHDRGTGGAFSGRALADESGQALVLAIGGCLVLIAVALALVAIAGAVTGKGRVQRAVDLAAISAVRSMRDELPQLLAPPRLPNGAPNPSHLAKATYLADARDAAFFDDPQNDGVDQFRVAVVEVCHRVLVAALEAVDQIPVITGIEGSKQE